MDFDIRDYRHHKEMILSYYNDRGIDYIAFVCSVSYVPVIAAYSFIIEAFPEDLEAKKRLNGALTFYDYEKVTGHEFKE